MREFPTARTNVQGGSPLAARGPGAADTRHMRGVPPTRALSRLIAVLAVAILAAPAAAWADVVPNPGRPFAATSVWNVDLPANTAKAPDSDGMVRHLLAQMAAGGPWINSDHYSVPVYTVPADQPTVPVALDVPGVNGVWNHDMWTNKPRSDTPPTLADAAQLQAGFAEVPIPPGARPAAPLEGINDRHIVIWQPSTDTMWEMWQARDLPIDPATGWTGLNPAAGWHFLWGARIDHVSQSDGVDPHPFGATASGLPLIGGLIRLSEIQAGHIDHALAMAIPDPARGRFVAPANRTDGTDDDPHAIPEGTRFRLDPSLDLASLDLPPLTRMMAEAAQRHGIIVRDRTLSSVAIYAEDPTPTGAGNVYRRALDGLTPAQVLAAFPWHRLEVVTPDLAVDPDRDVEQPTPQPVPRPRPRVERPDTPHGLGTARRAPRARYRHAHGHRRHHHHHHHHRRKTRRRTHRGARAAGRR